ncbi:MAG: UPF0182 family protein [Candidatus Margulisbacteria bacterium]|nr:UPF0182 family protein [Candidatus Margulisiibacteriota bacterium]
MTANIRYTFQIMKHWKLWLLLSLVIALILLNRLALRFLPDIYWFANLGYERVFFTRLGAQLGLWLGSFLFGFLFIFGNLYIARVFLARCSADWLGNLRALFGRFSRPRDPEVVTVNYFRLDWLTFILLGVSVFFALGAAGMLSGQWLAALACFKQTAFGLTDPLFARDIGFYVFTLPVLKIFSGAFGSLLLISALGAVFLYVLSGKVLAISWRIFAVLPRWIRVHLSVLGFLFSLWLLLFLFLAACDLLYSSSGVIFGAKYTDIYAQLPALRLLGAGGAALAVAFLANIFWPAPRWPFLAGGLLVVSAFVLGVLYPPLLQTFFVNPNEITKEAPYIKHSIEYTGRAYGLTDVRPIDFAYRSSLAAADVQTNQDIIANIRLWDDAPLLETYRQIQGIRLYYDFNDVDVDRYAFSGRPEQVMLSVRELDARKLPDRARTWINERLKYTHGYGLVLNKVTEVTEDGLPELVVRDIPPASDLLRVTRPEIYYGEKTDGYVIVNTKTGEFDYPLGDENVYTAYQGRGDVVLNSFFRRALYAAKFRDFRILISGYITPRSKILYARNIQDRARKIAPFLSYDSDPYIVCAPDGRLYWIIDAYTFSNKYPYAHPYNRRVNYIRNSVKVVIDAYHGTTTFYKFSADPILDAYAKVFPGLFHPSEDFPAELLPHIRYPLDLFYLQARMFRAFHMNDPQIFYNQEDLWEIPKETYESGVIEMEPYYIFGKIPGEDKLSFLLALPFTPVNKNNLIGLLAVKCDPDGYGRFYLYKMPKNELVYGPMQIESRIDQDTEIAKELSLWSSQGSRVIRGNMMVVPVADSLLYIEPVYLQATASKLPELKRIAVAGGETLAMTPALKTSLDIVTGLAPKRTNASAVPDVSAIGNTEEFARVKEALRRAESALAELKQTLQQTAK